MKPKPPPAELQDRQHTLQFVGSGVASCGCPVVWVALAAERIVSIHRSEERADPVVTLSSYPRAVFERESPRARPARYISCKYI